MADPREPRPAPGDEPRRNGETGNQPVSDPGELLRIGSMVGSLLEEAHNSALDDAGRRRLAEVYRRAVDAVRHAVSPELGGELTELGFSLDGLASSESELRLAQAQLVG